ncbi:MAG: hypothetical protein AAFX44_11950 [Pseudomonadota bacterium]
MRTAISINPNRVAAPDGEHTQWPVAIPEPILDCLPICDVGCPTEPATHCFLTEGIAILHRMSLPAA